MPIPMMPLPVDLMRELADHATDLGSDGQGNRHYASQGPLNSQSLLGDLRHVANARRDGVYVTVWTNPRLRAMLMASEGHARLVFYADQRVYDAAVQGARRGILPVREAQAER
jgi:hypothetical protein